MRAKWKVLARRGHKMRTDAGLVDSFDVQEDVELGEIVCEKVTQANARLIAAAPDLLDACKLALADSESQPFHESRSNADRALAAIRAAIAKAEGK